MARPFASLLVALTSLCTLAAAQHDLVRGVVILARNGDRLEYFQDPISYKAQKTEHTALGAVSDTQFISSSFL
jgi:hypothetical protein